MIYKRLLFLIVCIILFPSSGCSTGEHKSESIKTRRLEPYMLALPETALPKNMHLETVTCLIDTEEIQATFITGEQLAASSSLGVVQPLRVKNNHRNLGISFFIRSLSASCTLLAAIVPDGTVQTFIHSQPINLEAGTGQTIELLFKDFGYVSTRLNVDTDCFIPTQWDKINLFLVFSDCDQEKHGIEWGPVKMMRQNKLYRFY